MKDSLLFIIPKKPNAGIIIVRDHAFILTPTLDIEIKSSRLTISTQKYQLWISRSRVLD